MNRSVQIGHDEADIDLAYRVIRTLLVGLPRVQAPAGFEFRLQRRLEQVRSPRRKRAWESWILSWRWLSVGFGVATAVVVGLIFFEPQSGELPSMATTQSLQKVESSVPESSLAAATSGEIAGPDRSYTGSPERETEQDVLADQGQSDSLRHEFRPPSGHFQSVGGNP